MEKRKRNQHLHYFLITYNNPTDTLEATLQQFKADYAIGQMEKGESGTPHVQALLYYKTPRYPSSWKGIPCHWEGISSQDYSRVAAYVTKEDTRIEGPVEIGEAPPRSKPTTSGRKPPRDYALALELFKGGRYQEIEPAILATQSRQLLFATQLLLVARGTTSCRGIWIFGPPGTGKSTWARQFAANYHIFFTAEQMPDELYLKAQNKWWDQYKSHLYTLLEDLDKNGACLSHHLKIWADKYPFTGETKGGHCSTQYLFFMVTSNYLPSELWEDPVLVEAISRRFIFIRKSRIDRSSTGTDFGVIPL